MSNLEAQIRSLAKQGELTYLSVVSVAGKGENGIVYEARIAPASTFGFAQGRDADPVNAITKALADLKTLMPKRREARTAVQNGDPLEPWDT